jgi:two-component system, NtrC family, response regulator AtoC
MPHAVLIIEDEPTLARNMRSYLERQGYAVTAVATGEQGLGQLETFRPDLVLLDYQLPRMNGLEVLAHLRSRERPITAIMITGQGNPEIASEALRAGAYAYRCKPLALSDLKSVVEQALGTEQRVELLS